MLTFPLQAACEVAKPWLASSESRDQIIAAKCMALLTGYDAQWSATPYRILDVERVVLSDLYNPETGRTSRTYRNAGKIDVHAEEIPTGRKVLLDHKTTSDDITDPNSSYWRQLVVEGQVTHYMLLEWLNGRKVDYAIWDVIRKPSISPRQLTKKERDQTYISRKYCEYTLSDTDLHELSGSMRETPTMYAARLVLDCSIERPQWYFQRRQIPRLDSELREYAIDLWEHSQELISARRLDRYPRNSGACLLYRSPCKFLGICSGYDTADSPNWTRRAWVHPELPVIDSDARQLLTNSRIRTFQTCRRKAYFQYELGIERIDEEERDALLFGQKLHECLEQYFLALKTQQEKETTYVDYGSTATSVTGIEPACSDS